MGQLLIDILRSLDVNLELESPPNMQPGVIEWLGRVFDVSPYHAKLGLVEGMEIWSSGSGFAPIDLEGVEMWLVDVPRGNHLIICRNNAIFEKEQIPIRDGVNLVFWMPDDVANFVGHAVIDGRIPINVSEQKKQQNELIHPLKGKGPHTIKPKDAFTPLNQACLDIKLSKPILICARIHHVRGYLRGPEDEEIQKWVLDCLGLTILDNIELLEKTPLLKRESVDFDDNPNFKKLLSKRRVYKDGMGDLLRWYRFDEESANVEEYDVLVPAYKGVDSNNNVWIFDAVSTKLHRNF